MKKEKFFFCLSLLAIASVCLNLHAQDTIQVVTHDQVKVVTDPSKGVNSYSAQAHFPEAGVPIRKVNLLVTFECPDGLACGEWDYIDHINLQGHDPVTGEPFTYEIARLITPYGRFFGTDWRFTFKTDVTDFASLLRNQAIVEYVHTGYESNTTCGWKISVKFEFIQGPPVAGIVAIHPLWNGSFPYGNPEDDIEQYLDEKTIKTQDKTRLLRLRILQTGHGMDRTENCAEFCSKWREVIFNGQVVEHRDMWVTCGSNPVYPQAGTWIFDRANWCPGCMVGQEHFDLVVEPGSSHVIDVNMEPYQVTRGEPSANYVFSSFLIEYQKPKATHDVAIDEILVPSADDLYSRMNPASFGARIRIKNNGTTPLKSAIIEYGLNGQKPLVHLWKGELAFGQSEEVLLPGVIHSDQQTDLFTVNINRPNGRSDRYNGDNRMTSLWSAPPVYPGEFVVICKTNRDTMQNAWRITDAQGKIWFQREESELKANREYRDTVTLPDGHYNLLVTDRGGDGLEFWYNARSGMGYVRLARTDGGLIQAFDSDFGNEIFQNFTVDSQATEHATQDALVLVYPHRPIQNTTLMLHFNQPQTVKAKLTNQAGKLMQELTWFEVTKGDFLIDLSNYPDDTYLLEISYNGQNQQIRLKKARR